jgi:glucosamine--fructose-6-phosphate aminotransferase (isomerizing)
MTSHLETEIYAQPGVLRGLLEAEEASVAAIARAVQAFDPAFVSIAARGTSDNAARYAQYALGIHARLPVALATPSIHTLYEAPPKLSRALVIGISQSGMAADVLKVVTDARAQGALTLTMTNNPASPMAQAAHFHIDLHAGEEISVAATKTYTAQLVAVAMLVAALSSDDGLKADLARLPDQIARTLDASASVAAWAANHAELTSFAALGRAYNYCTAIETCLKVQELCYIIGQGYSEADFLHGPIAIVSPGFPVIVFAPKGRGSSQMRTLFARLAERRAQALIVTNDESMVDAPWVLLPTDVPEWLSPVSGIVPGQLLGMHLAVAKGRSVDRPAGLTKVTVTV